MKMQNSIWKRITGVKGESAENTFHSGKVESYELFFPVKFK